MITDLKKLRPRRQYPSPLSPLILESMSSPALWSKTIWISEVATGSSSEPLQPCMTRRSLTSSSFLVVTSPSAILSLYLQKLRWLFFISLTYVCSMLFFVPCQTWCPWKADLLCGGDFISCWCCWVLALLCFLCSTLSALNGEISH